MMTLRSNNTALRALHPQAIILVLVVVIAVVMGICISSAQGQVIELFEEGDFPTPHQEDGDGGDQDSSASGMLIDRGEGGASSVGVSQAIRLNYQRAGQSVLVKAHIGRHEVYFIFDTGASYTTLTGEFAARIGATPQPNYPRAVMQTAGGMRESQFGLLPRLRLGEQHVENITFTVCDACGGQTYEGLPVVGLLGLNILRRYRISMDDSNGVVELDPHRDFDDRSADIDPWIEATIQSTFVDAGAGQMVSRVEVMNLSPRQVRDAVVELQCTTIRGESRQARTRALTLRARGSTEVTLHLNLSGCAQLVTHVSEGRW